MRWWSRAKGSLSEVADPHDLQRFVNAQANDYSRVVSELRAGLKSSHWIWFVFPQLKGLGRSATAERYGIASLAEARAYLSHPVLGPRLGECAQLLLAVSPPRPIAEIFGDLDALKVRSSMTLFYIAAVAENRDDPQFDAVLDRYYDGEPDWRTLELLNQA